MTYMQNNDKITYRWGNAVETPFMESASWKGSEEMSQKQLKCPLKKCDALTWYNAAEIGEE